MITMKILNQIKDDEVFAAGIMLNNSEELYMTNTQIDKPLFWIAKKGYNNDWCIYCGWLKNHTIESLERNGDKVSSELMIQRCMPCTNEVYKKYRR